MYELRCERALLRLCVRVHRRKQRGKWRGLRLRTGPVSGQRPGGRDPHVVHMRQLIRPTYDVAPLRDWIAVQLELQRFLPAGATLRLRRLWGVRGRWWWDTARFSTSWPMPYDRRVPAKAWVALVEGLMSWPSVRATWFAIAANWFLFAYAGASENAEQVTTLVRDDLRALWDRDRDAMLREFVDRTHDMEALLRATTLERARDRRAPDLPERIERAVHALCFGRRLLRDTPFRKRARALLELERAERLPPPRHARASRSRKRR